VLSQRSCALPSANRILAIRLPGLTMAGVSNFGYTGNPLSDIRGIPTTGATSTLKAHGFFTRYRREIYRSKGVLSLSSIIFQFFSECSRDFSVGLLSWDHERNV
jgi:hypothetical protein